MNFSEIIIAFTGIISIWLSQSTRKKLRRYACIFGLAGQPFWFYVTYIAEQWGIFALSFAYTFVWLKGLYIYWFKKRHSV